MSNLASADEQTLVDFEAPTRFTVFLPRGAEPIIRKLKTAQWALDRAVLLTPMMEITSSLLGGLVLIAIGVYQWTPLSIAVDWRWRR